MQRVPDTSSRLTTESRRLRGKLELVLPGLLAVSRRLIDHPALHMIYPDYLVMLHGMMRASVPLMETALVTARTLPDDQVAVLLADYLERHIPEERCHDDWLLADLESIGVPRKHVLSRLPSPSVATLVGAQYYWVQHVHPVGLLGYIALLEGYPPARQDIDQMQVTTGYGPEAFRTLLLHSDVDPHHGDELDELLDSLPVSEQQRTLMGVSGMTSVHLCTQTLQEVLDRS